MHIGILQAGHAPEELRPALGDYANLFEKLLAGHGFDFTTWNVVDMVFPAGPDAADGWLITGSKHGAYDDLPFIAPLEDLIREIYASDKPLVGVCFGHQIIAQALGGRVEKFAGGWAIGRQTYDWQGAPVALNAWHQDQVVALPPGAQTLASNSFCSHAALVYDRKALTVQAHPEFGNDVVAGLARTRGPGVVPDDLIAAAQANLDKAPDNAKLAAVMARFFKERVA